MCPIAGILRLDGSSIGRLSQKLHIMNTLQAHRGPDGQGIWTRKEQNIGFAHRRLSIIDLSNGQQPMTDGGGNWVCFNGEIYNYIELRHQLDVSCSTSSATEIILHAYRR